MPNIHINFVAVLIAVVANFVLGALWYMPLFGRAWAKEMGMSMEPDQKPAASVMIKGMVIMVIGNFLFAWVFAHNMAAWNPVTWGLPPSPMSHAANATAGAVFTWLGFFVPNDIRVVAWERKSWKLFFINTTYHLASLFVVAFILECMQ